MPQTDPRLSPTAVQRYTQDGFVALPHLLDAVAVARVQDQVREVEAMPEIAGRHMVYYEDSVTEPGQRIRTRIENFVPYHGELASLLTSGVLTDFASQLLGEDVVLFKDKINLKLPGGGAMAAHQDVQAGWSTFATRFISAMVAIEPAAPDNGCLEIVAGAHTSGHLGDAWAPLTSQQTSGMTFIPLICAPGDVVFFDGCTPHRSAENRSARSRRALYVTWSRAADGDARERYYRDKRASYPPECERDGSRPYVYRV